MTATTVEPTAHLVPFQRRTLCLAAMILFAATRAVVLAERFALFPVE